MTDNHLEVGHQYFLTSSAGPEDEKCELSFQVNSQCFSKSTKIRLYFIMGTSAKMDLKLVHFFFNEVLDW